MRKRHLFLNNIPTYLVLLTLEHLPYDHLVSILEEPEYKDFSIYADEDIRYMIIKICYGQIISTVYCLIYVSALTCILRENRSNTNLDPSHVIHPPTGEYCLDSNNNALLEDIQDDLVVNLSQQPLTEAQIQILSRGLKFCPNPGEPDISTHQADLDKFHLRLKRFLHFHKP